MGNYRHTVLLTVKCIRPADYALYHLLQNLLRAGNTVTRRLTTRIRSDNASFGDFVVLRKSKSVPR